MLRDKLDGSSDTGTITNATFSGTMAGAASWAGLQTFAAGIAASNVTSGTYTPTLTNAANLDATPGADVCQYMRVGSVVTVSGRLGSVDPTATGTYTAVGISLPIASDFANSRQCGGTGFEFRGGGAASVGGMINADITNNRATLNFSSNFTTAADWWFTFTYLIV